MSDFQALSEAVHKGDIKTAVAETQAAMDANANIQDILDNGLIATMDEVGDRFSKGIIFVPQMLRSAKTMQECMKLITPFFQKDGVTSKGKVLIGTVKGDLHDIGKNLVSMMMEGAGFTITDLGVDVPPEKFVQKVQEIEPDIVAMSALLSTTLLFHVSANVVVPDAPTIILPAGIPSQHSAAMMILPPSLTTLSAALIPFTDW